MFEQGRLALTAAALGAAFFAATAAIPAQAQSADVGFHPLREHAQTGGPAQIRVLSSRNDLVSGGDALVEIAGAKSGAKITLNGQDVTKAFRASGPALRGLVTGMRNGENKLAVSDGASLALTNWPAQGPMIAGPKETPFVCMTEQFKLPAGGTLGPARSADCDVPTRVDYVYKSAQGGFKPLADLKTRPADLAQTTTSRGVSAPFIVRVETGVINRGIYQTSMLVDPARPSIDAFTRPAAWNGGLIYTFGGGCPGGQFIQGASTGGVLDQEMLARGYAVASSSLNVFGNNCDDLLASETMMMVKEHFAESLGPPAFTIGWGCSGGSYQAEQIGDNYPGLLDGVIVGCSFPDVGHAAVAVHSFGARLVYDYYKTGAGVPWTEAQIVAVSGLPDYVSLEAQGARSDRINPQGVCNAAIPKDLLYNPQTNPRGARCSIYDHGVNGFGRDPATGFARRPLDNVGVQYGLKALNAGQISTAQFLDVNRKIGGVDIDAKNIRGRTVGDPIAMRRAYQSGRFLSGGGGLASIPIIDYRAYADFDKGDPHQRFHSFSFRERLMKANGQADNQVMIGESNKYGLFSLTSPNLRGALDQMEKWILAIQANKSAAPALAKIVAAKPADLVDACWRDDGSKIAERQIYGADTQCNRLYPPHANPFIQAGMSVASDIAKCVLKPIDAADYKVALTPAEMAALKEIFPQGVCDFTRPGVEQQNLAGTWLSFGPAGAGVRQ